MLFAGGIFFMFDEKQYILGTFSVLLGGAISLVFLMPLLSKDHVVWNGKYVEGPSGKYRQIFKQQKTRIMWSDIAVRGTVMSGYWYIQAEDCRKIHWNHHYAGYRAFDDAVVKNCPALAI